VTTADLLARVRAAWDDPGIAVVACLEDPDSPQWWCIHSERDGRMDAVGDMLVQPSEIEALRVALALSAAGDQ